MSLSNYPPGVTGREPEISGKYTLDQLDDYAHDALSAEALEKTTEKVVDAALDRAWDVFNLLDDQSVGGLDASEKALEKAREQIEGMIASQLQLVADELLAAVPEEPEPDGDEQYYPESQDYDL